MFLQHSIFCAAFKTTDNQIVQGCMALAASWPTLEFLPGNSIFCPTIQAPNNYVFLHINHPLAILSLFSGKKANYKN